ncbi:MAG: hypothetical protein WA885_14835 [Phormidesmis sp.]
MSPAQRNHWQQWIESLAFVPVSVVMSLLPLMVLPAFAQRTTVFDLDRAICANDWDAAIDVVGVLVASEETTRDRRVALLALRRQLESYRAEDAIVADAQACDRADPYTLDAAFPATVQTGKPLGWAGAVAEATDNRFESRVIATEGEAFALPVSMSEPLGLTPATPVDLRAGLTVVSGHVGPGHNVYAFVAGRGDRLEANLAVTQVMTGSLYTSDDSQLFIFDRQGNLITAADDAGGTQQSQINGLVIPKSDLYFAVVTSYNNDPIVNPDGRLAGWQDNGGGRFDYTLTLSGITPTNLLVK